jgi:hypothetical protein
VLKAKISIESFAIRTHEHITRGLNLTQSVVRNPVATCGFPSFLEEEGCSTRFLAIPLYHGCDWDSVEGSMTFASQGKTARVSSLRLLVQIRSSANSV